MTLSFGGSDSALDGGTISHEGRIGSLPLEEE